MIFTATIAARGKALLGGVALASLLSGAAFADPVLIYDLGGKFDKSWNETAFAGATKWAEETGKKFLDLEIQNVFRRAKLTPLWSGPLGSDRISFRN